MSGRLRSSLLAVSLATSGGSLVPATADAAEFACQARGWETRCLTLTYQQGDIVVRNLTSIPVTFSVSEWHSHCGWRGWYVTGSTVSDMMRPTEHVVPFSNDPDPLLCREHFVYDCKIYGAPFDCNRLLQTVWRTP